MAFLQEGLAFDTNCQLPVLSVIPCLPILMPPLYFFLFPVVVLTLSLHSAATA